MMYVRSLIGFEVLLYQSVNSHMVHLYSQYLDVRI